MHAICLGGGPAGVYFGISPKLRDLWAEIMMSERNRPDDTLGWAVVPSGKTLQNLAVNDPDLTTAIRKSFASWGDRVLMRRRQRQRISLIASAMSVGSRQ